MPVKESLCVRKFERSTVAPLLRVVSILAQRLGVSLFTTLKLMILGKDSDRTKAKHRPLEVAYAKEQQKTGVLRFFSKANGGIDKCFFE